MALAGEIGWIGKDCPYHGPTQKLVSDAMESNAGWFLGTYCPMCRHTDPSPHSRETAYYPSRRALVEAMLDDTVKWRDTAFKGIEARRLRKYLDLGAIKRVWDDYKDK